MYVHTRAYVDKIYSAQLLNKSQIRYNKKKIKMSKKQTSAFNCPDHHYTYSPGALWGQCNLFHVFHVQKACTHWFANKSPHRY